MKQFEKYLLREILSKLHHNKNENIKLSFQEINSETCCNKNYEFLKTTNFILVSLTANFNFYKNHL
ncbi:hypothetical protein HYN86_04550 [Flavobacterium fluviale]|uniref:Uncharacterized protein n=1 Tax=Flavobacterium fluviale TaxID=2249356 RepID=A0A344LPR9_9FLAO|nr:hypothetical protein HYN86_04550 [Flavobacterium fluviale]